jgi:hypothetical protein
VWRVTLRALPCAFGCNVLVVLAPEDGDLPLWRSARLLEPLDA